MNSGWFKPLMLGFLDAIKMFMDVIFSDTLSTNIMDIPRENWEDVMKESLKETTK